MSSTDAAYIAQVTGRIVRMFQRYMLNIDPENERFLTFISSYLKDKKVDDARAISYVELYGLIKQGIREYLHQTESDRGLAKREES